MQIQEENNEHKQNHNEWSVVSSNSNRSKIKTVGVLLILIVSIGIGSMVIILNYQATNKQVGMEKQMIDSGHILVDNISREKQINHKRIVRSPQGDDTKRNYGSYVPSNVKNKYNDKSQYPSSYKNQNKYYQTQFRKSDKTKCYDFKEWSLTDAMHYNRSGLVAVLLINGKVLAIGGRDDNSVLKITEWYDPLKKRWMLTGNMNFRRVEHTASILKNGKVLVAGGYDNNSNTVDRADLYDTITERWELTGSMKIGRSHHKAVVLNDGNVLAIGGQHNDDYPLNETELYNPFYGTWRYTSDMNYDRRFHTASLLQNGKVLVAGGLSSSVANLHTKSVEIFDPATEQWTFTTNMTVERLGHTATVLNNGKVLITGGVTIINQQFSLAINSTELYDSLTEKWTPTGNMNYARYLHVATLLKNGKVLVTGGVDRHVNELNITELYDPSTETWTTLDNMHNARVYHSATLLPNGAVLTAGGINYVNIVGGPLNTAELSCV